MRDASRYIYPAGVCLIAVLIFAGFRHFKPAEFFTWTPTPHKHPQRLVIGVLSARENHAQRQAIRDTWLGHIRDKAHLRDEILVRFIVGRNACHAPPALREEQFACEPIPELDDWTYWHIRAPSVQ